ncbi:UNVERIFIED_CONTAM: Flvcr2 [Trichonephila clavipes]
MLTLLQLGIALGFLLPPQIVPSSPNKDDVKRGLSILFYSIAAITSVIFLSIVFFFKEKPPLPPSRAQAAILTNDSRSSYWTSIWKLCKNLHYMLLLITYGKSNVLYLSILTSSYL